MTERRRQYRDDELLQVQTLQKKLEDMSHEIYARYLGEAEQILVDIEVEFAYLIEMMDEWDEDDARGEE